MQCAVWSVQRAFCSVQCAVWSVQRAMKRKGGHRLCSFVSGWPLLKGGAVNGAWGYMGACLVYTSQPPFLPYIEFICASLRILLRALCVVHEDDFVTGYCLFLYERHPLSLWCSSGIYLENTLNLVLVWKATFFTLLNLAALSRHQPNYYLNICAYLGEKTMHKLGKYVMPILGKYIRTVIITSISWKLCHAYNWKIYPHHI